MRHGTVKDFKPAPFENPYSRIEQWVRYGVGDSRNFSQVEMSKWAWIKRLSV